MAETTKQDCWNSIGIGGNGTCPHLPEFIHCRNCPVYSAGGRMLLDREPPENYLQEWTDLLRQAKAEQASGSLSVVVFRLAQEYLAVPARLCQKVIAVRGVHRIPHRSDALLLGLVNVDGVLYLCANLSVLLGLPVAEGANPMRDHRQMVVVMHQGARWVFPVLEVTGLARIDPDRLENIPITVAKATTACSKGIFHVNDRPVTLLNEQPILETLDQKLRKSHG